MIFIIYALYRAAKLPKIFRLNGRQIEITAIKRKRKTSECCDLKSLAWPVLYTRTKFFFGVALLKIYLNYTTNVSSGMFFTGITQHICGNYQ